MIDTYVSIDLETTGFSPVNDKIIEIGALKYENGVETDRLDILVNPGRHISDRITQITGISDDMVADAPYIGEVIEDVCNFMEGFVLLGHNLIFDYSFLKAAASDKGISFEHQGIDTLKIAKKVLSQLEKRSLEYLCEFFSIETIHHRALADAQSTSLIYQRMCQEYEVEREIEQLFYKVCKQEPITWKQKNFLEKLCAMHHIVLDEPVEQLSKSEASRKIDGILSEYGRY